ncbi:SRPBCC domain-containing protein [Maricaulis sp.]|jgi:uncharacterized protein YndB with AHSA1/START domain|uniref:SRPBCC family protein n=1 Tax=Maricaulis sp. TaxID=1486257 RepID=UPI002627D253|nr:SRPBCC domain-containing protein [Maricaulis sp.]
MTDLKTVTTERHFEADAADVFNAWLDPEHARHWLFTLSDSTVVRCEIDPRPGGRFVIVDRRAGGDVHHVGEFIEIDRPRRIIFRFQAGESADLDPADGGRVTVTVLPEKTGCRLTLVQELPPQWAEYEDRTREGWEFLISALAAHLGVWVESPTIKPFDGDMP